MDIGVLWVCELLCGGKFVSIWVDLPVAAKKRCCPFFCSVMEKLLQHEFRSMEVLTSLLDRVWQQQVAFQNMDLAI